MALTKNTKIVLDYLQKHPDEYETGAEIGVKLNMSTRQIISAVNRELVPQYLAYYQPLKDKKSKAIKLTVKGKSFNIDED